MKKVLFFSIVFFSIGMLSFKNLDLFSFSDSIFKFRCIEGNGKVVKQKIEGLRNFDGVAFEHSGDVILTQGDIFEVIYEGESNLLEHLEIKVEKGSLDIEMKNNNTYFCSNKDMKIYVTMPEVKRIALGGSGEIRSTNSFRTDNLKIALGGSGNVSLRGTAKNQSVAIGGSGDVDLSDMSGETCRVAIGGSGTCNVNVSNELRVAIGGSGDVYYKGNPKVTKSFGGSGNVIKQ